MSAAVASPVAVDLDTNRRLAMHSYPESLGNHVLGEGYDAALSADPVIETPQAPSKRTTRRRSVTRDEYRQQRDRAHGLMRTLGLPAYPVPGSVELQQREWDPRRRCMVWRRQWTESMHPVSERTIARGLAGDYSVAMRTLRTTRHVAIDIDCHGIEPAPGAWDDERAQLRRRVREAIAERVRPIRDAVAELVECDVLAYATPRGVHLVIVLTSAVAVEVAHAWVRQLVERIGHPELETFPVPESSGGRTCRIPSTGPSRRLAGDLVSYAHRRRADDVEALMLARRLDVECVTDAPTEPSDDEQAECATQSGQAPGHARLTYSRAPRGDGDDELRALICEQQKGRTFGRAVVLMIERGVPDDCSQPAMQ